MHDPKEKPDGIFCPEEGGEMAEELKRLESRGGPTDDREELAADIIRRKRREHGQADRQKPNEARPCAEIKNIGSTSGPVADGNGPEIDPETPYTIEELAAKYGLTHRAAEVVLMANGPTRRNSDVGAAAFVAAAAAYRDRRHGA